MREPKIYEMAGGYGFRMDVGIDPKTGKRQRQRFGPFRNMKETKLERARIMRELHEGKFVQDRTTTFKDFMLRWLDHKKNNVSPGTYDHYRNAAVNHLIPNFGQARLDQIKPVHIQELYDTYVEEERLSNQSIVHMHRVLNNAYKTAIAWELAYKNPCSPIKPPKPEKHEMQTWDEFEVQHFLDVAKGNRFYIAYLLALTTGMRKGEVLGLRWQDIDFNNHTLSVRQAVTKKAGIGYKLGKLKTDGSQRNISLFKHVIEELKKHRKEQMAYKMEHRKTYKDQDLVTATSTGSFVQYRNFYKVWEPVMIESGLKFIRFHDFRHTHASLMLKQGVHPKIVQERLGHSSITVTLDLYSHVLPNMQKSAAEQFGKHIFGGKDENKGSL